MLFKITLICDEIADFLREITIDAEATFLDLNKTILKSCSYPDDQMTSFYLCNDSWEQGIQITREDMGTSPSDEDIYVMEDTNLSELIEDEKQRLVFVFDPFNDRVFYMDVTEFIPGKRLSEPICNVSKGKAPKQILDIEAPEPQKGNKKTQAIVNPLLDEEEFYGTDDFAEDEFDPEGFEISDGDPYQ
ncbi:MAG: hypothetical protein RR386_04725 [Bacteroidaceae bacterium]